MAATFTRDEKMVLWSGIALAVLAVLAHLKKRRDAALLSAVNSTEIGFTP